MVLIFGSMFCASVDVLLGKFFIFWVRVSVLVSMVMVLLIVYFSRDV